MNKLPYIFYCVICHKTVEKKPKKFGNTTYLPIEVTHIHKNIKHLLELVTPDEISMNPYFKGAYKK